MSIDAHAEAVAAQERDDVSFLALVRRPHDAYNPHLLVRDVIALLQAKGIGAELPNDSVSRRALAEVSATDLLRSLGVLPTAGPEVIDRRNAPDPHDR